MQFSCVEYSHVQRDYQASAPLASVFFVIYRQTLRQERMRSADEGMYGWIRPGVGGPTLMPHAMAQSRLPVVTFP
jgi:hypothetical protein